MPFNGLIFEADAYEFWVKTEELEYSQINNERYHDGGMSNGVFEAYARSRDWTSDGIPAEWEVRYDGPNAPFGGWTRGGNGYRTSIELRVRYKGIKVYGRALAMLRVEIDEVELWLDGALEETLGPSLEDQTTQLRPSDLPFLGYHLYLYGSCGASGVAIPAWAGSDFVHEWTSSIESRVTGGSRFQHGGTWYTLPATLQPIHNASGSPFDLRTDVSVTNFGLGTINLSLTGTASYLVQESAIEQLTEGIIYSQPNTLTMVPDLEKSYQRLDVGHRALWLRYGFPGVKNQSITVVSNVGTTVDERDVYPETGWILGAVGDARHPLESPMTQHSYSFANCLKYSRGVYDVSGRDEITYSEFKGLLSTSIPDVYLPINVDSPGIGDLEMIVNTWCNPHWNIFNYCADWVVDDQIAEGGITPGAREAYWMPVGQQWLGDSILPSGERTGRRTTICADAMLQSAYSDWNLFFTGSHTWVGVSRWKTQKTTAATSKTCTSASAGLWITDIDGDTNDDTCTATVGANVVLSPLSGGTATTYTARMLLASYEHFPYLYGAHCKTVKVNWVGTNLTAVRCYFVGADGTRQLMEQTPGDGQTTPGVQYTITGEQGAKYAGTWGTANLFTWAVDDIVYTVDEQGTDTIALSGQSGSAMSDELRAYSPLLLHARGAKWIEFEIDVIDNTQPVTLNHPVLYWPDTRPVMLWETRQNVNVMFPDAGTFRFYPGAHYYTSGGTTRLWPNPILPNRAYKPTIIDGLVWRRLALEAKAYDDGLTTELTTLYDTFEGQGIGVVDGNGYTLPLPKPSASGDREFFMGLVNTTAEVPPIAMIPYRKRNSTTWEPTGDHAQAVYTYSVDEHHLIHPESSAMTPPTGAAITTPKTPAIPGWSIMKFSPGLANNENDYRIKRGSKQFAEDVRPWFGYLWAGGEYAEASGPGVWSHHSIFGEYSESFAGDDGVSYRSVLAGAPVGRTFDQVASVTGTAGDSNPAHVHTSQGHITLFFERGGDAYETLSYDDGVTWSAPSMSMANAKQPIPFTDANGYEGVAWWEYQSGSSGPVSIKLKVKEPRDAPYGSVITLPNDFTDDGFGITCPPTNQMGWVIVATLDGDTSPSTLVSYDQGETWEVV